MSSLKRKNFFAHYLLLHSQRRRPGIHGFTLIELLVTALVATGIITGLLYLTNELLTSDTRESNRTETQRDLQLALDFMASEVRQAMHVYTPTDWTNVESRITLPNHPDEATAPVPVLAFWKQQPLSQTLKTACATNPASVSDIACFSGHSYSFVIYAFSQNTSNDLWQGDGGILRYELAEDGGVSGNYVGPVGDKVIRFTRATPNDNNGWPFATTNVTFPEPEILIDFVDYSATAYTPPCATGYEAFPASPRGGFYSCINLGATSTSATRDFGNQDVILYLHGNAKGRSGLMTDTSFLPSLEAQVFARGVLEKTKN